ncbi:hypothetical protein LAJ19_04710 [Deinococcus taeanensis]|uniref:hypothetical protein n=1 Tax=Deinococcus taeanensis TaxID=2737050 RepID=UPI001CDCA759|nr:hypothetical protein [Deinococcus taeanensis]UBV43519.1 hypothetical protein LAJ19_04710 [Deinococcus taeanensis]
MTPHDLATLLDEANHAPRQSVTAALARVDGQPHPRVAALAAHLSGSKRECWTLIAQAAGTDTPPDDAGLTRLMAWEVQVTRTLPPAALTELVSLGGTLMTIEALLRLNARHTAWHAGQVAALARRTLTA